MIRGLAGSGAVISIDTMKPEVARAALKAGAHLVNDVSGLRDPAMRAVCAEWGAPACIMHMQGGPRTMQLEPHYLDVVAEVFGYLRSQAELALAAGVPDVLIDPGIGFGKTPEHNLSLLRALPQLTAGTLPVVVGASRKKFLGQLSGEPQASAETRDAASLALHLHSARQRRGPGARPRRARPRDRAARSGGAGQRIMTSVWPGREAAERARWC